MQSRRPRTAKLTGQGQSIIYWAKKFSRYAAMAAVLRALSMNLKYRLIATAPPNCRAFAYKIEACQFFTAAPRLLREDAGAGAPACAAATRAARGFWQIFS